MLHPLVQLSPDRPWVTVPVRRDAGGNDAGDDLGRSKECLRGLHVTRLAQPHVDQCAFLAYCLQVTLKQRLRSRAPGLTPRSVLDKMAAIQMADVHLPTTDRRTVILSRYTEPEPDQALLLQMLKLSLRGQQPPKISPDGVAVTK